jgi:long-chain acyl-CoA synthetase
MKTSETSQLTINSLFEKSCEQFLDRPFLSMAFKQPLTYGEVHKKVLLLATHLLAVGVKKRDKIAILAENSPNWGITYLAITRLGAMVVPVLPDFTGTDVRHILTDAKVKILFTTQRQIEKIYELADHKIKKIITLDNSVPSVRLDNVETFTNFLNQAELLPEKKHNKISKIKDIPATELCSIIYTSGTSGHSKAVMLTHGNLVANVSSARQLIQVKPDWTFLSILPMSHTYEFTLGFLLPIINGARIVYAGKAPTPTILERICRQEKPDIMCVVPVVMEKIHKKRVMAAIEDNKLLKIATKIPLVRQKIYQKIGKKLLNFFGGKLQTVAIGGAPMNIETETFFHEAKFPYIFGYGLTESSPLLSGGPMGDETITVGSTGKPIPGVEIKIVNPDAKSGIGEIYARGPNIMRGYYNNPEATAETLDDEGWLATGDLGKLDSSNNLHVTGRCKSVIVLANGENIFPETIEEKINADIHIAESLIIENNGRLEARIHLDYDFIAQQTRKKNQRQRQEYIDSILENIRKRVNDQLPAYSRVHKFIERQEPFIKTATHKIKRYLYVN